MNYKQLGKAALPVSTIGFGCMSLGNDQTVNDQLIHGAQDRGINFFDTADLYGNGQNEITVGKALRGRRREAVLATKVGNEWRADGSGWAKGLLVDKPATDFLSHNKAAVQQAADAVRSVSGAHRSPARTALRFVLQQPAITSAIVGIRTLQQLEDAAGVIDTPPLTEQELQYLQAVLPVNFYQEHR